MGCVISALWFPCRSLHISCCSCRQRNYQPNEQFEEQIFAEHYRHTDDDKSAFENKFLFCEKHKEKFQYYCVNHCIPLCITCIEKDHQKCKLDTKTIEEFIENSMNNEIRFDNIKTKFEDALSQLKNIRRNRVDNVAEMIGQNTIILDQLSQTNEDIAKCDVEVQELGKYLSDVAVREANKIKAVIKSLQSKEKFLTELQDKLHTVKDNSNYEQFLVFKYFEKILDQNDIYVKSLTQNDDLLDITIKFRKDNGKDLKERIFVERTQSKVFSNTSEILAQVAVTNLDPKARTFHVQGKGKKFEVSSCCLLPNGEYAFTDVTNSRLVIHSKDDTFKNEFHLKGVFDATVIDDKRVAITGGIKKLITLLNIENNHMEEKKTEGSCFGICYLDGFLIFCVDGRGLQKMNIESLEVFSFSDENLPFKCYVTRVKDHVCLSNHKTNELTLLNVKGEVLWKLNLSEDKLLSPRGLTSDRLGNIYVTGYSTENILFISADGKQTVELYGKEDGLDIPNGIMYDAKTKKLLVVNRHGTITVFFIRQR